MRTRATNLCDTDQYIKRGSVVGNVHAHVEQKVNVCNYVLLIMNRRLQLLTIYVTESILQKNVFG